MPDGMEEVGFAQTRPSVDKQGVVRLGWLLSDGDSCSMGEAMGGADYERVEGVLRVEAGIFTAGRDAVAAAAG